MMTEEKKVQKNSKISLREVNPENFWPVINLSVADDQDKFVASNAASIAQAYFYREEAWFRAIYADETPVGFLMLSDNPEKKEYFLWRLMVDKKYQGMGFGRRGVELLVEHVKSRPGATKLGTSCVPGEGSPFEFYKSIGFKPTGEVEDGEDVLELAF
jgi:diamine N-acetyltransferase